MTVVIRTVANRAWSGLIVLWGACTISFAALRLTPGDPVDSLLGPQISASPSLRAQITADLQLDQPLWEQYVHAIYAPMTGNLGRSYQLGQDVWSVLAEQLPASAELAAAATALAVVMAVTAAVGTAGGRRSTPGVVSGAELLAVSVPVFWSGLLLLTLFSFQWHLFPPAGARGLGSLVLPAFALALPLAGELAQVLRGALDRALEQPFITTLRARGLPEIAVRLRHALRHASLPAVTMTGWMLGSLFTGTVLVETLFARPGIGRITLNAVLGKDFPVVTAVVLLAALLFVVINLLVDLLYLVLDPRLRERAA